jgi:hypothetical protein
MANKPAVKMIDVDFDFWVVTPCGLPGGYQRFRGMFVTTYKMVWHHNPKGHD